MTKLFSYLATAVLSNRARRVAPWAMFVMLGAICAVSPTDARSQSDPVALQQQAIASLDALRERTFRAPELQVDRPAVSIAEAQLEQSNRALEALGDWRRLVTGLIRQGKARYLLSGAQDQLPLVQRAVQAAVKAKDSGLEALALAEKSRAELDVGDFGQALTDAKRALRLAEALPDRETQAKALSALGAAQRVQGDVFGATETAQREVAVASQVADRMVLNWALDSRIDSYLAVSQLCRIQQTFDACSKALDIASDDSLTAAGIARDRGYTALVKQEEFRSTLIWTARQEMRSTKALAETQARNWPYAKSANDLWIKERVVALKGGMPKPMLDILKGMSDRYDAMFAAPSRLPRHDPDNFFGKGIVSEQEGLHAEALDWYLKAAEALDRDRRKIGDERGRSMFLGPRISIYQAAAMQLLDHKRYAEAFDMMERSRSRVLADMLESRPPLTSDARAQALYAETAAMRERIASRQALMFSVAGLDEARRQDASYSAAEKALRDDEAAYEKLLARMAVEAPKLASLASSRGGDLGALQRAMLEDGFEMLQYIFTPSGLVIWHTSAAGSHVRSVMVLRGHLVRTIAKVSASLRDPLRTFDESAARELYFLMIEPIKAHIGSKKLLILPTAELSNLPFQALIDPADGRFLGEKFQITYAPSGTVWLGLEKTKPLGQASALALGGPESDLPGVIEEIASIERTFAGRGTFRSDRRPQEADLRRLVSQADVVHLAVHGNFSKTEPMLSYLKLDVGGGEDGMLTATEMFALPLTRKPLVVLSACETGLSGTTASGEMLGMSRALLYAGANALLLSQWRVNSEATARWMQAFYRAAASSTLAEAAKTASDRLRADPATRHPFYWAPFLLTAR